MDDLLSPQQLATYLGVPVGTIYGWNYDKSGPTPIKVGRHVRYRTADVQKWLDRNVKIDR